MGATGLRFNDAALDCLPQDSQQTITEECPSVAANLRWAAEQIGGFKKTQLAPVTTVGPLAQGKTMSQNIRKSQRQRPTLRHPATAGKTTNYRL